MTQFDAYILYLAIRQHFERASYDAIKYRFKVNAKQTSLDVRKDKYMFHKLSKADDPQALLVSNLVHKPDTWIGSIVGNQEAKERCDAYLRRRSSFGYWLKTELSKYESPDDLLEINNGNAKLFELIVSTDYGYDLAAALNQAYKFLPYWRDEMSFNPIASQICDRIEKYMPFLPEEQQDLRKLIRDKFSTN